MKQEFIGNQKLKAHKTALTCYFVVILTYFPFFSFEKCPCLFLSACSNST